MIGGLTVPLFLEDFSGLRLPGTGIYTQQSLVPLSDTLEKNLPKDTDQFIFYPTDFNSMFYYDQGSLGNEPCLLKTGRIHEEKRNMFVYMSCSSV